MRLRSLGWNPGVPGPELGTGPRCPGLLPPTLANVGVGVRKGDSMAEALQCILGASCLLRWGFGYGASNKVMPGGRRGLREFMAGGRGRDR